MPGSQSLQLFSKSTLAFSSPKSWLATFARQSILSALNRAVSVGYLVVEDREGSHVYGNPTDEDKTVHIEVLNDDFWLRLILWVFLGPTPARLLLIGISSV